MSKYTITDKWLTLLDKSYFEIFLFIKTLLFSRPIKHPDYVSNGNDFDYVLVELVDPINFELYANIRPICLPTLPSPVLESVSMVVLANTATHLLVLFGLL